MTWSARILAAAKRVDNPDANRKRPSEQDWRVKGFEDYRAESERNY